MSLSVIIASSSGYIFKYSNKALSETLANSEGLLIRDSQLSLGHPSFVAINSIFNYFQAEARMRYWLTMMLCVFFLFSSTAGIVNIHKAISRGDKIKNR